jgi:hypothetical protein
MQRYNVKQATARIQALSLCRVGAIMLATLVASGLIHAYAQGITFNTTDDGMSLAGMFFAKLDSMNAKHMSGAMAKVRLPHPSQNIGKMLLYSSIPLQTGFL